MSPRAGLSPRAVVDAALGVIDEQGPDGLTLAAVAARTGVATPSLYKHIAGLPQLRLLVVARILGELAEETRAAVMGREGGDAVAAVLRAYRSYARTHPHRYATMPQSAEPEVRPLAVSLLESMYVALRGCGLADDDLIHATRCLRAVAHGFASLESQGGFGLPDSIDETYEHLVSVFITGLAGSFPLGSGGEAEPSG